MHKSKRKQMPQKKKPDERLEVNYSWLLALASSLGYVVKNGREDEIVLEDKIIHINNTQSKFNQIIGLAHELGHAITLPACIEKFGSRALRGQPKHWPSLEAELLAWSAADILMDMLGMYDADYVKLKHTFLRRYYRISKKNKS